VRTNQLLALSRSAQARVLLCLLVPTEGIGVCCFVSLRMSYKVPRVSPGVAAPILRSPPSRATPGLPSSLLQTECPNDRTEYPGLGLRTQART
jgi:hypothetical protein